MALFEIKNWICNDGKVSRCYFTLNGKNAGFFEKKTEVFGVTRLDGTGSTSKDIYTTTADAHMISALKEIFEADFGYDYTNSLDEHAFFNTLRTIGYDKKPFAWSVQQWKERNKKYAEWIGGVDLEF